MWMRLLFSAYITELLVLLVGVCYVTHLWLKRQTYINPYLSGRRLKVAAIIPFAWFIYIYSDAYAVYDLIKTIKTITPSIESALMQKAFRQFLSLFTGTITTLVLIGYKFGEE